MDIPSVAALRAELRRIDAEVSESHPEAVELRRANGDALTIVLGTIESTASFVSGGGDPPYFASSGDSSATGVLTFFMKGDHHTEVHRRYAIEHDRALAAAEKFIELQSGLPDNLVWDEV